MAPNLRAVPLELAVEEEEVAVVVEDAVVEVVEGVGLVDTPQCPHENTPLLEAAGAFLGEALVEEAPGAAMGEASAVAAVAGSAAAATGAESAAAAMEEE